MASSSALDPTLILGTCRLSGVRVGLLLAQRPQHPQSWPQRQSWNCVRGDGRSTAHPDTVAVRPQSKGTTYWITLLGGLHVSVESFGWVVIGTRNKGILGGRRSQQPPSQSTSQITYSQEEPKYLFIVLLFIHSFQYLFFQCVFSTVDPFYTLFSQIKVNRLIYRRIQGVATWGSQCYGASRGNTDSCLSPFDHIPIFLVVKGVCVRFCNMKCMNRNSCS